MSVGHTLSLHLLVSLGLMSCTQLSSENSYNAGRPTEVDISAKARLAAPEHVSTDDILRDNKGCYAIYDRGDKWVRPLLDLQGNQICD